MFKNAKWMTRTNQDIISEQCIKNDDGVLAVSDEGKNIAWKRYHRKSLSKMRT